MISWLAVPILPAHGLGGAKDLPIPATLAITGGMAALVVSFAVLILAWRAPRYDGERRERSVPPALNRVLTSPAYTAALQALGLLMAGYLTWALLAGPDLVTNPVFGFFYVLVWVGIVPASLAFGRIYRALSPIRTLNALLARLTGADPRHGLYAYPARLGYWPAAIGLFAFVWQELVNPSATYLGPVRLWLAGYAAAMLLGGAIFGETWFSRADPFQVYSDLVARLSPWARSEGRIVLRSPLANVASLAPRPGLVAVVAVLFGSTAYDSYKDTLSWISFVRDLGGSTQLWNSLALLGFCLVIGLTFSIASRTTGIDPDRPDLRRRDLPARLAHSVVPIIAGYMTAHYLSYFVEQGQATLIQLSDPLVRGDNLLGTANWSIDYWLSLHPSVLASVKVLAVVAGHIVGVIAAHDRALSILPRRHQILGQLGLLVIMVAYTGTGLYLLFGA